MVWFIRVIWVYLFVVCYMISTDMDINPNMIVTTNILCFIVSFVYGACMFLIYIASCMSNDSDPKYKEPTVKFITQLTRRRYWYVNVETLFELLVSCLLIYTGHVVTGLFVITATCFTENLRYNKRKELNIKD